MMKLLDSICLFVGLFVVVLFALYAAATVGPSFKMVVDTFVAAHP